MMRMRMCRLYVKFHGARIKTWLLTKLLAYWTWYPHCLIWQVSISLMIAAWIISFRESHSPLPPPLPGESLKSVLLDGAAPLRQNALVEFDDEYGHTFDLLQMRMLVTNDYKLVYYSPTEEVMLFDRKNDPDEMANLALDDKYTDTVNRLMKNLLKEISRTEIVFHEGFGTHNIKLDIIC